MMTGATLPTAASRTVAEAAARPWKRALGWLLFLGPFFFLSYGLATWWTARLPHVGSFRFAWETQIPFVEWTIVPYMSIDAFYAVSLFLCATRAELDTHAKRLLAATAISVTGFLLFPLQFSFARPPTSGFSGALFDVLTGFDKPFNQAPSLHISLLLLLWLVYARHLHGMLKWAMHAWFALIGISVFTTFQHHAIDGVGGVMVAVACVYLYPDAPLRWSRASSVGAGLAGRYCSGGVACCALATLIGGWAWLLLWPGTALLLVACGYRWLGVHIFQKHEGRASWAARALLLPYQAGAWLSSRWLTRHGPSSAQVVPGVWIGRAPGRSDWNTVDALAVLDLAAEFHSSASARQRHYQSVPMLDLVAPSAEQLLRAVDALDGLRAHAPVLVHCALGYSRSALVIAAWLLRRGIASTADEAVELVRAARPSMVLPASWLPLLERWRRA
jgi:hypothetical protein